MKNDAHFVVIGGGHAAGQLLESVRKEGFTGRLSLVTEEDLLPYQRPHLSKLYLAGQLPREKLLYRPKEIVDGYGVEAYFNTRVVGIDRDNKTLALDNGEELRYDKLALTVGARVRELPLENADAQGVFYLRTAADTDRIRTALATARNVVLVGGGFLNLEAASVMIGQGKSVTVLEVADRVMANAVSPAVSSFYEQLHHDRGVELLTGTGAGAIETNGAGVEAVATSDGRTLPADLVLISIGIIPNTELAEAAGLQCDNGICVDEYATTGDPDIVAAGDCTHHPNGYLDRSLRLESVHNAVEQAKTAAAAMCGRKMRYNQVPWFWSDQYEYRLQMVGVPGEADQTVQRGDPGCGSFSVLHFNAGRLTGCHAVNRPVDYISCRKIMENNLTLDSTWAENPQFDLRSIVPARAPLAFQNRA